MERLGLWGEGTPSFASFPDFLEAVGGRGVGALELVAMDMKARGMFVCRTLSFKGKLQLSFSCWCCIRRLHVAGCNPSEVNTWRNCDKNASCLSRCIAMGAADHLSHGSIC